jgi:hypothetical protein
MGPAFNRKNRLIDGKENSLYSQEFLFFLNLGIPRKTKESILAPPLSINLQAVEINHKQEHVRSKELCN